MPYISFKQLYEAKQRIGIISSINGNATNPSYSGKMQKLLDELKPIFKKLDEKFGGTNHVDWEPEFGRKKVDIALVLDKKTDKQIIEDIGAALYNAVDQVSGISNLKPSKKWLAIECADGGVSVYLEKDQIYRAHSGRIYFAASKNTSVMTMIN